jgi:hypothetical protein
MDSVFGTITEWVVPTLCYFYYGNGDVFVPKCPSQSGYQIGTPSQLLHIGWCMGHDVFGPLLGSVVNFEG